MLGKGHVVCHRVTPSSSGPQCSPLYSQCPSGPRGAHLSSLSLWVFSGYVRRRDEEGHEHPIYPFTSPFIPSPSCYNCLYRWLHLKAHLTWSLGGQTCADDTQTGVPS